MNGPFTAWAMWTDSPSTAYRVLDETGFVLHQVPYRESSSLVDVFTRQHGRLRLLAKGHRKPGSGRASLQAFTTFQLSWSGRSSLQTLIRIEPAETPFLLTATALYCGLYLNELLLRLLPPGDPYPLIYTAYRETLTDLSQTDRVEPGLRYFELLLLESLGYGLSLDRSVQTGHPIEADQHYRYIMDCGLEECEPSTVDALPGSTLTALKNHKLSNEIQLRQAKRLMRRLIDHYTQGKPIRSRALFQTQRPSFLPT